MSATLLHDPQVRVFFALWPSTAERAALSAWQSPLHKLCDGRVMRPDTLHVTLAFIGELAAHRLAALKLAAQEVTGSAFEIRLDQARYWKHNHIVHADPSVTPMPLAELVAALEQKLREHRFTFDARAYQPHVTLLRNARWDDTPLPAMPPTRWSVRDFVLVQSLRNQQGAHYEVLAHFPLKRG